MRSIWLVFTGLLGALGLGYHLSQPPAPAALTQRAAAGAAGPSAPTAPRPGPAPTRADSLVRFALAQQGTAYCYAGTSPRTGFDCSGFVQYVFGHFGVATPHSTALLIGVGRPVARAQAQPGDLVVFAGTAPGSTTPGHAGIVISALGEVPLRFVHASSARRASGVKVSAVEGSGYETRFLGVRRVL
ncbi:C40 family peptidase [Hymenobacter sp. RP-2-7]|uniref:C40 family peptidase n=1 Tax=Hymenobacter polaris TaxID=2682546 RepID=A0A7Y0ABU5_9BACT|nr:C40 family peptidase [Hymenobacter polaris]NML64480.1 C40 family peptidase [Hymenobacter polaris]